MRIADQDLVKNQVLVCISQGELQFYLGLLTQLKADDLITEDARQEAIWALTRVLAYTRDATNSQSPSTPGE